MEVPGKYCPYCNCRLAMVRDFDVYLCENEHIISGVEMEDLEREYRPISLDRPRDDRS